MMMIIAVVAARIRFVFLANYISNFIIPSDAPPLPAPPKLSSPPPAPRLGPLPRLVGCSSSQLCPRIWLAGCLGSRLRPQTQFCGRKSRRRNRGNRKGKRFRCNLVSLSLPPHKGREKGRVRRGSRGKTQTRSTVTGRGGARHHYYHHHRTTRWGQDVSGGGEW
jgi:hypothetical protein